MLKNQTDGGVQTRDKNKFFFEVIGKQRISGFLIKAQFQPSWVVKRHFINE